MAFNPDEYLKEDFNPDAYLSDFNPDEYLSETPSLLGNVGTQAVGSLAKFNQMLASGPLLASQLVDAATGSKNPVTRYIEETITNPNRQDIQEAQQSAKEQEGFLGKGSTLVGQVGGMLPEMLAGGPIRKSLVTAVDAGAPLMTRLLNEARSGLAGATPLVAEAGATRGTEALQQGATVPEALGAQAGAMLNMAIQGTAPMGLAGNLGKRVATGVAANPLLGAGGRVIENVMSPSKMYQDPLDPESLIADAVLGGTIHGVMGERGSRTISPSIETRINKAYDEGKVSSPEEGKMLEFVKQDIDAKIKEIQDAATVLGEKGDWSKQNVDVLAALDKRMEELVKSQTKVESILNGDITNTVKAQKGVDLDLRVQEKVAELKAKRGPRPPYDPIVKETDIARVDEGLAREPIPEPVLQHPAQEVAPKTSPMEVAVQKIDEAIRETPDKVADRIFDAEDRLASIKEKEATALPGEDYSALKAALQKEIAAYELIQKGERDVNKLTSDWADVPPVIEPTIEATIPKYADMVSLLEDVDAPLVENLRNNEQLFTKIGNTQIDSRITGTVQKIVSHFINVTGLGKDDIYVLAMDRQTPGALNHVGNTSIIKLDINKINEMAASSDTAGVSFGGMVGKKLTDAKNTYAQVRVAAHEIGHILFNKYMQNFITDGAMYSDLLRKWGDYKKTSKFENVSLFDFDGGKRSASLLERQKYFHEFFAEQVTKELIHKHTLGAFVKGSKIFEPLIQASRDILKKAGIDVDNKTFATTIIQDIIAKNEESIKATGETIFEKQERLNADQALTGQAPLFSQKTLQEMAKHSRDSGFLPSKGRTSEALMALDVKDLPVISSRMIHALGKGSGFLARKFFGKIAVKEMQMKEGAVQDAYWKIRKAEEYSEAVVNRLWNGDVKPSAVGFTDVLSKVKASDSVFVTLTKATYSDLATLHDVFNKGLQEGLEYADNLKQNGQHLTPEQVKYYNSIADLYTKMYDESAKLQQDLGKKWVLPKKAGWFQSVRSGNYAVTISFGDIMAHRQHFQTQLQAEKFLQKLKESGLKHLEVSEVIDTRKQPAQSNKQMADIIRDALSKDFPHGKEAFEDRINSILDSMNVRGGKLGQHHKYRFNVPGYKGTEFFKSKEELGKSFKEAIEYAIAEKGNQLKQMQIDHQLKTLLEEGSLKTEKPESYAAIQQMYDSTLGRNEALFDGSKIDYTADKVLDSVYNVFGKEYAVDKSAARSVYEGIKESFYLTKMMPKMMFSIIGQVLSVPPGTISHLSYGGHGARAYLSFAKGLTKLSLGDKALWKAIKEDSQQYNVFEPAFIEAMSLQDSSKPVYKAFKDYVLMQAPGKAMDSVSRVMTYAIAKTHFTDLGMSEKVAREQARFATGKILNLYDKANAAPVFSHLGGIGDVVQPLMGFGQNALGSLIAAVKHVSPKDYRTWGPLVNYTLVTIATSGIMGMQFIQEYEQFRRYINKNFNDFTLPSILDIFASDDGFLNRLTPLSEQERQTAMYGVPSLSGLDLASSVRANETFPTLIAGLVGGWTQPNETMAMLSWGASVPGAMVDIGQAVSGNKSLADTRKAFDVIAPAGHLGYAAKKAIGLENTNVLGGTTDMLAGGSKATAYAKEQPIDVAAGIMGGKTTQRRWDEQRDFETAEKEQNLSAKKDRAGVLYVETGNPKFIDKMVELGMTEKQIVSKIELELHNRLTPQEIRLIANKAGKVVKGSGERKAIQLFKFGQKE